MDARSMFHDLVFKALQFTTAFGYNKFNKHEDEVKILYSTHLKSKHNYIVIICIADDGNS